MRNTENAWVNDVCTGLRMYAVYMNVHTSLFSYGQYGNLNIRQGHSALVKWKKIIKCISM